MKRAAAKGGLGSLVVLVVASLTAPSAPPPTDLDFTFDVLPVLQRQGCSSAYCHGSATGRAGFHLSLFGSDPAADYAAITTQLGGRRLDRREVDQSLLLQKALGRLDHGGGRRLVRDGTPHQMLRLWIAAGAPWQRGSSKTLQALAVAVRGERLVAQATFRAGDVDTVLDVSDVALFSSTDPTVAEVGEDGLLDVRAAGQAFLLARFGNLTASTRLVRPFAVVASEVVTRHTAHGLDRAWREHLHELGIAPALPVNALQLARRLHMDLVGRPPTPHELDAFAANPDVAATAARLVARPEFAEVWGAHLARWFEAPMAAAFVEGIRKGDSLTTMARRVALGTLGVIESLGDSRDRAEYVGRALLGMRIGCARCHDHPLDRWRRSEHLAFSACFALRRPDGTGGTMAGVMFDNDGGEAVEPHFLSLAGTTARPVAGDALREAVADFVVDRRHDAWARNACNRVFASLFGRGLVEPLDDHRLGNAPCAASMLQALVEQFHRGDGSLAALVSFIVTAAAYAAPTASDEGPAATHFAARASRALTPDAYVRAVDAVLGRAPSTSLPTSPLARELALRNGPLLHEVLAAGHTTIDATFELGSTPQERLVELWRTVLSRPPRAAEVERFLPVATADLLAFRDLAFALLTGREFGHRR